MSSLKNTIQLEIDDVKINRPHVVILGAGASLAAFPQGEKNGKTLPVMSNIIETIGLNTDFEKSGIQTDGRGFEDLYSDLVDQEKYSNLLATVENKVHEYFSGLKLFDRPTIYDYLVLSLRKKDVIATFNWDPFLWAAAWRNHARANLPHLIFLHGNTAVEYCHICKVKGPRGYKCDRCGKGYAVSRLLYPIKQKNYNDDDAIRGEWTTLGNFLKNAFMLTIFGYSAPIFDVEAKELMKTAWNASKSREIAQTEIIHRPGADISGLYKTWEPFIFAGHYETCDNFFSSWIAKHPRRTCDAMWNQLMECKFLDDNPAPRNVTFENLWKWFDRFKSAELIVR